MRLWTAFSWLAWCSFGGNEHQTALPVISRIAFQLERRQADLPSGEWQTMQTELADLTEPSIPVVFLEALRATGLKDAHNNDIATLFLRESTAVQMTYEMDASDFVVTISESDQQTKVTSARRQAADYQTDIRARQLIITLPQLGALEALSRTGRLILDGLQRAGGTPSQVAETKLAGYLNVLFSITHHNVQDITCKGDPAKHRQNEQSQSEFEISNGVYGIALTHPYGKSVLQHKFRCEVCNH